MIYCVRFKPGVTIVPSPGGARILACFDHVANFIQHDFTVTSGSDGQHSGPDDPHHHGNAYDGRTHDLPDKQATLQEIKNFLGEEHFYAFIEDEGTPNEHIHAQVRKGTIYPPVALSNQEEVQSAATGE